MGRVDRVWMTWEGSGEWMARIGGEGVEWSWRGRERRSKRLLSDARAKKSNGRREEERGVTRQERKEGRRGDKVKREGRVRVGKEKEGKKKTGEKKKYVEGRRKRPRDGKAGESRDTKIEHRF